MNAAYLMLTTAWLAGADPVPATPAAPVMTNGSCGCCGGMGGGYSANCNSCDDGCGKKPGLFSRLFARKGHDDCGCEQNSCESSCKPARERKCRQPRHHDSCDTCNTGHQSCNTCDSCNPFDSGCHR